MSVVSIVQELPQEMQWPMLRLVEALEKDMRDQLAVRRQDFDDLRATMQELAEAQKRTEQRVEELAEAQKRTEQRVERLEVAVQELAEAQKRTEQRVERLEVAVQELAEAQKRTEQRVERLEVAVQELAEAQKRTEQRVEELAEAQKRTEEAIQQLTARMERAEIRLDKVVGDQLERRYRERASAYLGRILRHVEVISPQELCADVESVLSEDEVEDLLDADLVVRGQVRARPEAPCVWLIIEVSAIVDRNDVRRAQRRAALLRRAGRTVIAAVAGEGMTQGGQTAAREEGVLVLQDGKKEFWDKALAQALST